MLVTPLGAQNSVVLVLLLLLLFFFCLRDRCQIGLGEWEGVGVA